MKEVYNLKLQTAENINSLPVFAVTIIGRGYMIDIKTINKSIEKSINE